MKIAFAFWGITRSLNYTINSINDKIFSVLKENNIDYHIFMHTYNVYSKYNNKRANECNVMLDNNQYNLLNPDFLLLDDQDEIKKQLNLTSYRTKKDPWNSNYQTMDNFILAMYSKSKVTLSILNSGVTYDYIIFLRPDVTYLNRFDLKFLEKVNDNTICIPNFHNFGPYNFNDRFCICNHKNFLIYGDIFDKLLEISKISPLHSETVIGKIIHDNKINVIRIPFTFLRTRCNGHIIDTFK